MEGTIRTWFANKGRRRRKMSYLLACHIPGCYIFFFQIYHSLCDVTTHTPPHWHKSPPHPPLKFPMHARQRMQWAFVRRAWSRGWFLEALLKAITIGVESTHDNWFAGSKWETTTNRMGGGGGRRKEEEEKKNNCLDWHPVTVINFTNRPVWRSV